MARKPGNTGEPSPGSPGVTSVLFAASAGMLAAFNPCGFALLPTYLALFLGTQSTSRSTVARALIVGAAVTAGFVSVFGVVGLLLVLLSVSLGPWLSWVTLASGVVLVALGIWLLSGRALSLGRIQVPVRISGSPLGMAGYGVAYAAVSLSCTLPVFVAAVLGSLGDPRSTPWTAGVAVLAYALGMGAVLTTLALVVGLAGNVIAPKLLSISHQINRVSGAFVLLAGL
ncbi:MAG: cytochrome c biogenesis protein CcdA, partial [Micropruina sp.]